MNEELQGALTELINKSMNGVDAATGFLAAEIPDVVAQLLMWHSISNIIQCLIGLALAVFSVVAPFKYLAWCSRQYESGAKWTRFRESGSITSMEYDSRLYPLMFLVFPFLAGLFMINLEWLKIWIAPKVWLLEYAASLAK